MWLPAVHTPAWQVSFKSHALPSLHVVPFEAAGFEHMPVLGLHVPATWHRSLATQTTGFAPVHVPLWHVYVWSQRLVPVHVVPSATVGFEQTPVLGLHVPASWHWSSAVQTPGFEPVH